MEYEAKKRGFIRVCEVERERDERCMIKILSGSTELVWTDWCKEKRVLAVKRKE